LDIAKAPREVYHLSLSAYPASSDDDHFVTGKDLGEAGICHFSLSLGFLLLSRFLQTGQSRTLLTDPRVSKIQHAPGRPPVMLKKGMLTQQHRAAKSIPKYFIHSQTHRRLPPRGNNLRAFGNLLGFGIYLVTSGKTICPAYI
jgi:hypothetical protein